MKLVPAINKLNGVWTCKGCCLENKGCSDEQKEQCGDDKIFVEES